MIAEQATKLNLFSNMNWLFILIFVLTIVYLPWGQTWTPAPNLTESDLDYVPECSKCERVRLIGCKRGNCFYRCTRRCLDINGTAYHGK